MAVFGGPKKQSRGLKEYWSNPNLIIEDVGSSLSSMFDPIDEAYIEQISDEPHPMKQQIRDAVKTITDFSLSKMLEPQVTEDYQGKSIKFPNLGMAPEAAGAAMTLGDPAGVAGGLGYAYQTPKAAAFLAKVPAGVVAGFKGGTKADLIKFIGDTLERVAPNAEKVTKNMLVDFLSTHVNEEGKATGLVGGLSKGPRLPAAGSTKLYGATGDVKGLINTFVHESWAHGLYDHIPGMKDIASELWEQAPKHIKDAMLSLPKYQKMKKAEVIEEFFAYNLGGKGGELFGLGKSPYYNQMTDETWNKVMNLLTDPKVKVIDPEIRRANLNKAFREVKGKGIGDEYVPREKDIKRANLSVKEHSEMMDAMRQNPRLTQLEALELVRNRNKVEKAAYSMDEISKSFRDATERVIQQAKGGGVVGSRQSKAAIVEPLQPRTKQEAVKETTSQRKRIKEVDMSNYKGEATSVEPIFDPTNKAHLDAMDTWINKTILDSGLRDPNKIAKLRQSLEKILLNK